MPHRLQSSTLGMDKEWKQFVQNRVTEIRELVPVQSWRHCPVAQNPAGITSRGASPAELREKYDLWLYEPAWLSSSENPTLSSEAISVPED